MQVLMEYAGLQNITSALIYGEPTLRLSVKRCNASPHPIPWRKNILGWAKIGLSFIQNVGTCCSYEVTVLFCDGIAGTGHNVHSRMHYSVMKITEF